MVLSKSQKKYNIFYHLLVKGDNCKWVWCYSYRPYWFRKPPFNYSNI